MRSLHSCVPPGPDVCVIAGRGGVQDLARGPRGSEDQVGEPRTRVGRVPRCRSGEYGVDRGCIEVCEERFRRGADVERNQAPDIDREAQRMIGLDAVNAQNGWPLASTIAIQRLGQLRIAAT